MTVIGITGPSGSGKSTVLEYLAQHGVISIDCDKLYHSLLDSDSTMLEALQIDFPSVFIDNKLDRKALGKIVFERNDMLAVLEGITHPIIKARIQDMLADFKRNGNRLIVIEAISLIESGLGNLCNYIISIVSNIHLSKQRIIKRDMISIEYASARLSSQKNLEFYENNSAFVLTNNGNLQDLYNEIDTVFSKLNCRLSPERE